MEWLEITANSVEEAKETALSHLGVDKSDAEFEVLSEGRTGLFGRLKEEARVRARVTPANVRSRDAGRSQGGRRSGSTGSQRNRRGSGSGGGSSSGRQRATPEPSVSNRNNGGREARPKMDSMRSGPSLFEQADMAEDFVRELASMMDVSLRIVRHDVQGGVLRIEATGDDIGLLVGHRGSTAQAVDELVRTVLHRSGGSVQEGKIRVDIGGLRARRAAALEAFAQQMADDVVDSDEEVELEPMNRMDRKIVHDAIAGRAGVASRSEGEEPNRRVVIVGVAG